LNAVDGKRGAELPGGGVGRAGGIDQHDAAVLAAAGEAKLAIGQTDDTGRERESVGHGARMVGKILDLLALEDRWVLASSSGVSITPCTVMLSVWMGLRVASMPVSPADAALMVVVRSSNPLATTATTVS
jgi:hypothetical protein